MIFPTATANRPASTLALTLFVCALMGVNPASAAADEPPDQVLDFLYNRCTRCHDPVTQSGGLDLDALTFNLDDPDTLARWVRIHDRVRDAEMPPPSEPEHDIPQADKTAFLHILAQPLAEADRQTAAQTGRADLRRLNRQELENTLRDLLDAPWLQVAEMMPEDGRDHHFSKVGRALDISHVQLMTLMEVAEHVLDEAIGSVKARPATRRYYTRQDPSFIRIMPFRTGNGSPERCTIPLLGTQVQPLVIAGEAPVSVGESDPATRENEAFGLVSSSYTGTVFDFSRFEAPASGRYRLSFRTWSFRAGPNGANRGGKPEWWKPSREVSFPSDRSEPVSIYALTQANESRKLGSFDALPEPAVASFEADLVAGETIRPDAARLFRSRPGWKGNPLADETGSPGVAFCWMEVEGPLQPEDNWPPAPYRALFGDLAHEVNDAGQVVVTPRHPDQDARRLLDRFVKKAYRRPTTAEDAEPFFRIFQAATAQGLDFTQAMKSAYVSVLCSPRFMYLMERPGPLDPHAQAARLSYFLWNAPPDQELLKLADEGPLGPLQSQAERLLDDPRSTQFLSAFLDDWLDLAAIDATAPDAVLYPDYYLDDLLKESAVEETRRFFAELVRLDLPARNLVDSDFTFLNEKLAAHYGLPPVEGVDLHRFELPPETARGGLMTQASVLKVTANGTTTSPVLRGVWIADRLLGEPPPPPPPAVPAIEPDIRGARTIREQLEQHRKIPSCAACHAKFDPFGLALEPFDVMGANRTRYRAIDPAVDPEPGVGKNGHFFEFHQALPVDSTSALPDGARFDDVESLKQLLLRDERKIARNLARQLVVYATGAPVRFGDREALEAILDRAQPSNYGVRSLILSLIESPLFTHK